MKILMLTLIFIGNPMLLAKQPIVYYVFDPLCGWCYGFSPIITKAYDTFKD